MTMLRAGLKARWSASADDAMRAEVTQGLRTAAWVRRVGGGVLDDGEHWFALLCGDAQAVREMMAGLADRIELVDLSSTFEAVGGRGDPPAALLHGWRSGTIDPMVLEALAPALGDAVAAPDLFTRLLDDAQAR